MNIKVKKHFKEMPDLKILEKGDWIDLMICDVEVFDKSLKAVEEFPGVETKYIFKKDNMYLINLGVSIKLPKGYEAYILPRSSTPKKYGLILGNSQGIIDSSYCGNSDIWKALVYTTKDVEIERFTRLFQFRIQENQPKIDIVYVENMSDVSRGGFGSTGHQMKYFKDGDLKYKEDKMNRTLGDFICVTHKDERQYIEEHKFKIAHEDVKIYYKYLDVFGNIKGNKEVLKWNTKDCAFQSDVETLPKLKKSDFTQS